jgi:hypothetical protein
VEGNRLVFPGKLEEMEKKDLAAFNKPGNLNSMTKISVKKK